MGQIGGLLLHYRLYVAEKKFITVVAGIQALLVAWAVLLSITAGTHPLAAGASACKAPAQG